MDEIMVFRAYTNAINHVLGKTPVRHLELSSKQERRVLQVSEDEEEEEEEEEEDVCFSTLDSAVAPSE